ncbi:MAG TPA: VOC family protein [Noviherbaspirillum sp.]
MRMLVDIDVPDLGKAIAFYCSALELRFRRMLDEDVAELAGGSSLVYLLKKDEGSACAVSTMETRRYARHWTPVHVDFVVDDIAQATKRAIDAGATRESACIRWRGSSCVTFSDPFGNGFCLIEFAGETYSDDNT